MHIPIITRFVAVNIYFFITDSGITFINNILLEVKYFLYNLYQIFVINAVASGIDHINNNNEEDEGK